MCSFVRVSVYRRRRQDPQQTEVRLLTGGAKAEEDQLGHLASLYSLRVRRDAPGSFSAFKTGSVHNYICTLSYCRTALILFRLLGL